MFKKPWTLSDKNEFMIGVGPEWIHANAFGVKQDSVAAEVAPDFMFWFSQSTDLVGISNRATSISSGRDMSIHSASTEGCLSPFLDVIFLNGSACVAKPFDMPIPQKDNWDNGCPQLYEPT